MKRDLKIIGGVVLVLLIALVCYMMFGGTSFRNDNVEDQVQTGDVENVEQEIVQEEKYDFEQDTTKALEDFFRGEDGYENLEGEYGFTSSDID